MKKKNILMLLLVTLFAFAGCNNGENGSKNEVLEMKASKELLDGYKYYEATDARLIMQYPETWKKVSADSSNDDFDESQIELDSFVKQLEDNNVDSIWLKIGENTLDQISYSYEEIKKLDETVYDDEDFITEFLDKNDYDVIQTFDGGSLTFIEESSVKEYGDHKFVTNYYVMESGEDVEDIHVIQTVAFSKDRKHFLLMFSTADRIDEMQNELESVLASFEYF